MRMGADRGLPNEGHRQGGSQQGGTQTKGKGGHKRAARGWGISYKGGQEKGFL